MLYKGLNKNTDLIERAIQMGDEGYHITEIVQEILALGEIEKQLIGSCECQDKNTVDFAKKMCELNVPIKIIIEDILYKELSIN